MTLPMKAHTPHLSLIRYWHPLPRRLVQDCKCGRYPRPLEYRLHYPLLDEAMQTSLEALVHVPNGTARGVRGFR